MNLAEEIRSHVIERHMRPARMRGTNQLVLRAGDIHRELGLTARMPSVCSAMEGSMLCENARVHISDRRGPKKGANVYITYELNSLQKRTASQLNKVSPQPIVATKFFESAGLSREVSQSVDLDGCLVLVSCTKSKLSRTALAEHLYTSTFFRLARKLVERRETDWRILSANYGLLDPREQIEPYELTLNSMPIAARKKWAEQVIAELLPLAKDYDRVVFLAGHRYREFVAPALVEAGVQIDAPMSEMRQGEQLAWLGSQ